MTRLGWYKSFEPPNLWPISRRTAEQLIAVQDYFVGNTVTYKNLPASWGTLYAITIAFKSAPEKLVECLADARVHPLSTRAEARASPPARGGTTPGVPKTAGPGESPASAILLDHSDGAQPLKSS
jgi:hypothetical protein